MNYWLMKSEPDVFSIHDLSESGVAGWDGVRNYQARNFMRSMKRGDWVYFYHSNANPSAIVGWMEVATEAYPDATQFDPNNGHFDPASTRDHPRWDQVDVKWRGTFPKELSLDQIRGIPALSNMMLLKRSRLSVQPVLKSEWDVIWKLCH
jgi:predicted RNA-binding protein with PUA-like domain